MGRFFEEARRVLLRAEQELQALMEQAVQQREYGEVPDLAGLAQRLCILVQGDIEPPREHPSARPARNGNARSAEGGEMAQVPSDDRVPKKNKPKASAASDGDYPRYSRKDKALVKTALSSDGTSTYEHRVDKAVLDAILQRMTARLDGEKSLLTAENLSDVASQDGHSVPSYQVYLVLGWLKREGLLRQHGRKGYSPTRQDSLGSDAEQAWCKLAEGE